LIKDTGRYLFHNQIKKGRMMNNPIVTIFLVLSTLCVLSACGSENVEIRDSSTIQDALATGDEVAEVDAECFELCVEKGESEDDCNVWCSGDKEEYCLEACIEKGESEDDCNVWCSGDKEEYCLEACIEKGESEDDCIAWCSGDKKDKCDDKSDDDKEFEDK